MVTDENATIMSPTAMGIAAIFSVVLVFVLIKIMQRNSSTTYEAVYAGDKPRLEDQDFTF